VSERATRRCDDVISVGEYKRRHVSWMQDRSEGLTADEEGRWAERLDDVWRSLCESDQKLVETWVEEQKVYRKENGMPECSIELTPGEKAAVLYSSKYELIVAEDDEFVVLEVAGHGEVKISTGVLLDIDEEESMFWLSTKDAEAMGLLQ
jgi:hypothetical protein